MKTINGIGISILSLTAVGCIQQKEESVKPNIVYILADDLGIECIGAYGSTLATPNID